MSFTHRIYESKKICGLLMIAVLTLGAAAKAEDPDDLAEPYIADVLEEKLIQSNIAISEWFNGVAEGLDLFLAGRKLTNRQNETSINIENNTTLREGENVTNDPSLNINLRLPNVEEYWQLKFTTYDEQRERRTVPRGLVPEAARERNYGATVGLFRKLGNVRAAFEPRIALQDPLKISHSLTFESVADLVKYKVNPKLQFYANPDQGAGVFTGFNMDFFLDDTYSITVINQGDYEEKSHLLRVTNGASLGQALTATTALSYNLFGTSRNQTVYHLESYVLSVGYSEALYKKILNYSLSPFLEFHTDNSFSPVPGVTLTVNLFF